MEHRLRFDIVCPNTHEQTVHFTRQEFEQRLSEGLLFHCNTCDVNWAPTSKDIAKFRKELASE